MLATDEGFAPDGRFVPLPEWDGGLLMGLFRERLLARLLDPHAISQGARLEAARLGDTPASPRSSASRSPCRTKSDSRTLPSLRQPRPGGHERDEAQLREAAAEPPRRRSSPSWARLIARVYQVDPLLCVRCGQKMQMIAFLTDQLSIPRILEHLGFGTQPQDKPPPPAGGPPRRRAGGGLGVPANWE